jgi:hypothetical protein
MRCPSKAGSNRQLALLAARLILQCAMAGSIPQTGMDEFGAMCLRAPDTTSGQPMACRERERVASRYGDRVFKVR